MSQLMPRSAAEAVASGAQLLDQKSPGWWNNLDPRTLRLSSCQDCVCGQLAAATYGRIKEEDRYRYIGRWPVATAQYLKFLQNVLGIQIRVPYTDKKDRADVMYGFNTPTWTEKHLWSFEELDREWRKAIYARREADKLADAAPVETQREVECAPI